MVWEPGRNVSRLPLYKLRSGGVDWGEVALKLNKVSWMLALLFCVSWPHGIAGNIW